jgi:hypothetical protein
MVDVARSIARQYVVTMQLARMDYPAVSDAPLSGNGMIAEVKDLTTKKVSALENKVTKLTDEGIDLANQVTALTKTVTTQFSIIDARHQISLVTNMDETVVAPTNNADY